MIYTVTFNPSLDYVIGAEKLEPGKINRTTRENIYPGCKGNNGEDVGRFWLLYRFYPVG